MKISGTKSFRLFEKRAPDWLFALYTDYFYHLYPRKESITIIPKGKYWLISNDNLKFLSPTAKYWGTNMKAFENRFEQCLRIERGDTFVDVGACIGETTIPPLFKVGEKGFVVAIEPESRNIKFLKANTLMFKNIKIVQKAAWNRRERLRFYTSYSIQGH